MNISVSIDCVGTGCSNSPSNNVVSDFWHCRVRKTVPAKTWPYHSVLSSNRFSNLSITSTLLINIWKISLKQHSISTLNLFLYGLVVNTCIFGFNAIKSFLFQVVLLFVTFSTMNCNYFPTQLLPINFLIKAHFLLCRVEIKSSYITARNSLKFPRESFGVIESIV
jgi:hypothetical protein